MTEDHEQDQTEERDTAARPVTAAARRERRASARGEAPARRSVERKVEDKVPAATRPRRRPAEAETRTAPDRKGAPTPKRNRADKSPSLLVRAVKFVREVVAELRKVIWPTRKQQITYTVVVLVFVSIVVAFVSGLDLGFAKAVFAVFA